MIAVRHGNGGGANPPRPLPRMIGGPGALVSVGGTSAPCPPLSQHPVVWSGCASESDPVFPPHRVGLTTKFSSNRGTSLRVAGWSRATPCGPHHPQVWHGTARQSCRDACSTPRSPRVLRSSGHQGISGPVPPRLHVLPQERACGPKLPPSTGRTCSGGWQPRDARPCGWSGRSVTLRRTTEYVHRASGGLVAARLATPFNEKTSPRCDGTRS